MTLTVAQQMFLNLPVKNLDKTIKFFTKLVFTFNPQFTDKNATCMIVGENIFVMLLVESFFQTFTKKQVIDSHKQVEALVGLSVENRKKVDDLLTLAIQAGGSEAREPQDHGWMYGRAFHDLDGHLWEIFYMDIAKFPGI